MYRDCKGHTTKCLICQKNKVSKIHYGKLPAKVAESTPWEILAVDLVGPYTVTFSDSTEGTLNAMTMIDPATGWLEVHEIKNKTSDNISRILYQNWLTRYPRPKKIIFDNGNEFKSSFLQLCKEYGIHPSITTAYNPQGNSVIERVHQVLGNMLRASNIETIELYIDDRWSSILSSIAWAVRTTYHTTLGASPAQLVYVGIWYIHYSI